MTDGKVTFLGKSRKFANGTIHENATGKFQILDRYLEDGTVMLKFQWLSGEKEGQIEDNKEINMNASIHKYQVSRGISAPVIEHRNEVTTLSDLKEELTNVFEQLDDFKQMLQDLYMQAKSNFELLEKRQNKYDEFFERMGQITANQSEKISRLMEIRDREDISRKMIEHQQEMVQKLIDKLP